MNADAFMDHNVKAVAVLVGPDGPDFAPVTLLAVLLRRADDIGAVGGLAHGVFLSSWLARNCASDGSHVTRLEVFARQPVAAPLAADPKSKGVFALARKALCLFGGAVDGESRRVIVLLSLAAMAIRVHRKTGKLIAKGSTLPN
jgi:hypothetical protein